MINDMTPEDASRAVEAILFAAGCPVKYEKIAEALGITTEDVISLVKDISKNYSDRGIELLTYDDSARLCTKPVYEDIIKSALNLRRSGTLSASSLEVLSVIAYHQPVTRAFIEQIRGVDSSYAIGLLSDRGLIECKGRLDVPGRPALYGTTETFLRCFGLNSLEELGSVENIT